MLLHEIDTSKEQFLKTDREIEKWLEKMGVWQYTINNDKSVSSNGDVDLWDRDTTYIPVKFATVNGYFATGANVPLYSLKGCPDLVSGEFTCAFTQNLTSLDYVPSHIGGEFSCQDNKIIDFHNIHKRINYIGNLLVCDSKVENILGIFFIKGLNYIHLSNESVDRGERDDPKYKEAVEIINFHLQGDRDLHACQEKLIEAGYPQLARI